MGLLQGDETNRPCLESGNNCNNSAGFREPAECLAWWAVSSGSVLQQGGPHGLKVTKRKQINTPVKGVGRQLEVTQLMGGRAGLIILTPLGAPEMKGASRWEPLVRWKVQRGGRLCWCGSWRHPQEPPRAAAYPWTYSTPVPLVSLSLSPLSPSFHLPELQVPQEGQGMGSPGLPTSCMRSGFLGTCSLSEELSPQIPGPPHPA